ncbi:MAG TPA: hypothetical protein PLF81_30760 [Candidatus Anammoximicrobium sp.]|nr:hypothetical protein [Candidatus Anammoximicrobium sp.]
MRISFDLDDTLICYHAGVPQEPRLSWFLRLLVDDEPLRLGTPELMRQLRQRGWEIWLYTTSNRRPAAVRRWLRWHGVRIDGMINQDEHDRHLRRSPQDRPPSKNPAAFGIDLHVDDSDGVRMEGERHGFQVVVVTPADRDWTAKVIRAADELMGGGTGGVKPDAGIRKLTPPQSRR